MTIDEIRALVAQKIAGQGSAVDAGGALPAILDGICDAIAAATPAGPIIIEGTFYDDANFDANTPKPSGLDAAFDAGVPIVFKGGTTSVLAKTRIAGQYLTYFNDSDGEYGIVSWAE